MTKAAGVDMNESFVSGPLHAIYHLDHRLVAIVNGGPDYAQQIVEARAAQQGIPPKEYTVKRVTVTNLEVEDAEPKRTYRVEVQATDAAAAREQIQTNLHNLSLQEVIPK